MWPRSDPSPHRAGLDPAGDRARAAAAAAIVRDIARGGLAGLLTGALVGGFGGRIVMRVAALLSPDATGRLTENGNRIGTISLEGTIAVLMFGGVLSGRCPVMPHGMIRADEQRGDRSGAERRRGRERRPRRQGRARRSGRPRCER